jgi:uncharacterized protein YbjT (DUF2867 family)
VAVRVPQLMRSEPSADTRCDGGAPQVGSGGGARPLAATRPAVEDTEQTADALGSEIELREGDYENAAGLTAAFEGAERVFLVAPLLPLHRAGVRLVGGCRRAQASVPRRPRA